MLISVVVMRIFPTSFIDYQLASSGDIEDTYGDNVCLRLVCMSLTPIGLKPLKKLTKAFHGYNMLYW